MSAADKRCPSVRDLPHLSLGDDFWCEFGVGHSGPHFAHVGTDGCAWSDEQARPTVTVEQLAARIDELEARHDRDIEMINELALRALALRDQLGAEVRTRRLVVVDGQGRERIVAKTVDVDEPDGASSAWAVLEVNDGTDDHDCTCVTIEAVDVDRASDPPTGVASVSLTARGNRVGEMAAVTSARKPTTAGVWFDPGADQS